MNDIEEELERKEKFKEFRDLKMLNDMSRKVSNCLD